VIYSKIIFWYYLFVVHHSYIFRGSSVVEQFAVNELVVGSNPTRGATHLTSITNLLKEILDRTASIPMLAFRVCCVSVVLLDARLPTTCHLSVSVILKSKFSL
jgi:hypothetical protein